MKRILISVLMITVFASFASANMGGSFDQTGTVPEFNQEPEFIANIHGVVNDGFFEDGLCGAGSAWTCATIPNDCPVIVDLFALGLWNFEGDQVAWIGGLCNEEFDNYESVCQDVFFDGDRLAWYWMAYVNAGGNPVNVTIDDNVVYTYMTQLSDHLTGYWPEEIMVSDYIGGVHTLCFEYEKIQNLADNYFIDHVVIHGGVATEETNFSTIKANY